MHKGLKGTTVCLEKKELNDFQTEKYTGLLRFVLLFNAGELMDDLYFMNSHSSLVLLFYYNN